MSAELRKRPADGTHATSGLNGKKMMTAVNSGRAPKVEPQDDPQDGQSQNDGLPRNAAVNSGGAMVEQSNHGNSAEIKRLHRELREAKTKADDAEKKRSEAAENAKRYERQAEEADRRARELEDDYVYRGGEMARLQIAVDQLELKLERATEGRERRIEAVKAEVANKLHAKWDIDRENFEKQIEKLKRQIAEYKRRIKIEPEYIFNAKLDCATDLYETIKMLAGMTLHVPLKFDRHGLSITTIQSPERPTVPTIVLKLDSTFFTEYECQMEFARRVGFTRLLKALECSHADQCEISHQMGSSEICFELGKSDTEKGITAYLKEVRGARAPRALSKVEYSVVFNVNSYQLDIISKKLSDEIFKKLSAGATAKKLSADATAKKISTAAIFIKAKQDKVTISTVENYVGSRARPRTWQTSAKSYPMKSYPISMCSLSR